MEPPEIQEAFERVRGLLSINRKKGYVMPQTAFAQEALYHLEAAFATQRTALDLMAKDLLAAWEVSQRRDY